jgi:hypothetical protein
MAEGKSEEKGGHKEDRFIGASIEEFLETTGRQAETGKYQDGTTIHPIVRGALEQFTKTLRDPQLRLRSYVFVFSRCCFIVLNGRRATAT